MPLLKKTIFCLALFSFFFPVVSPAADSYRARRDKVNIRLDSTPLSEAIGTLSKDETVQVVSHKYGWYQIKLPAHLGCWVWAGYIGDIQKNQGKVNATNLNIRSHPDLTAKIVGSLNKDDIVLIQASQDDWLKISCYPYARGWVHENMLEKLSPEEKLTAWIEKNLPRLGIATGSEKEKIEAKLIKKGKDSLDLIETYIPQLSDKAIYRLIEVLTRMGEDNPELIPYFFSQVSLDFLPKSTLYLDVLENILLKDSPKIPFFYLSQKGKLSRSMIQKAYNYLQEKKQAP